jgi:hypothetical protein
MLSNYEGTLYKTPFVSTGFIWLMIETHWRVLVNMVIWTFKFHKVLRISWLDEQLLATQEGLASVELISYLEIRKTYREVYWKFVFIFVYNLLSNNFLLC